MNSSVQRAKISDYQFTSKEVAEQMQTAARIKNSVKLPPEDSLSIKISLAVKQMIEPTLNDIGRDDYSWKLDPDNNQTGELSLHRYVEEHPKSRLLSGLDDTIRLEFADFIEKINDRCKVAYDGMLADTAARVQSDQDHVKNIEDEVKKVRDFLSQKRSEQNMMDSEKSRQARVFTDPEKEQKLDMSMWPDEELDRNEKLAHENLGAFKKELKKVDGKITELNNKIKPHSEEIENLENLLSTDLSQDKFRDSKISLEYQQQQIEIIRKKMIPYFDETKRLHDQILETEKLIKMLQCCIDASELKKDAFLNFPRRRQRILDRLHKISREINEMETLRMNLNVRWREVSGDTKDIIGPLGLKCDSKLYFL